MHFVRLFDRLVRQPFCSIFGHVETAMPTDSAVRLKYEPEYDLLSVWVGEPQPVDQVEVESGVYVRVTRDDHRAVGLEILEAAARFHKDADGIRNPAFARSLLNRYGSRVTA